MCLRCEGWGVYMNRDCECQNGPAATMTTKARVPEMDSSESPEQQTREQQIGGDHYRKLGIQPWDAFAEWLGADGFAAYLRGNVLKYLIRYKDKNGVEDLKKARHYLDKLIEVESSRRS